MCCWKNRVVVTENGLLCTYVHIPLRIISNIWLVIPLVIKYSVFLISYTKLLSDILADRYFGIPLSVFYGDEVGMERNNLCACMCVLMGMQVCPSCCPFLSVSHVNVFFPVSTKPPLSCVCLCWPLCVCVCICVCACACVFLCLFSLPSPSSFLSRLLSRSFFLSLSLTLAVSIFGETQQERQRVKSFLCPALSCCLLFSITGSNWLLSLSFFTVLVIHTHSRRIISTCSRFHRCVHKPQETI